METDGTNSWLPGDWDGEPEKPETWVYKGPLLGQIAEVEVAVDSYNGKENNKVSRYICRVPQCAQSFLSCRTHLICLRRAEEIFHGSQWSCNVLG